MSEVRITDELRLDAAVDVVWRAIEEDSTDFGRMVSGWRSGIAWPSRRKFHQTSDPLRAC